MFIKPARKVNRVFLHCSASDNPKHDDVSVIKKWHLARGWSDVGYHFFIKKNGTIQNGRPLHRTPAAQKGHNTATVAICCHGLKVFTKEQRTALTRLCGEINRAYGAISFHGHCEVSNKSCPVFDYREWLNLDPLGYMKSPPLPPKKPTAWERFLNWLKS